MGIVLYLVLVIFYNLSSAIGSLGITNLRRASPIYKNRVDITWDAIPDATLYQVMVIKNPFPQVFKQNASTNITAINHLNPGSTCTITCIVLEFNNTIASSAVLLNSLVRLTMNSDAYPDITNVKSSSRATSLNVSWDNFTNATLYKIVYTGGNITEERELKTKTNFIDIVGLTKTTKYNVMVLVAEINNVTPERAAQSNWYAFNTTSEGGQPRMVCQMLSKHIIGLIVFNFFAYFFV